MLNNILVNKLIIYYCLYNYNEYFINFHGDNENNVV